MNVRYIKDPSLMEDWVDIHYREENEKIEVVRNFFLSFQSITGKKDDCIQIIQPSSIYYLEVVDRKLFAYQKKEVYQLDYSLRYFLDCFPSSTFVQISKSTVVNLYKVNRIKTDLNMRLRLFMDNGEILILNRTYKKAFLDGLHHLQEVCHENH